MSASNDRPQNLWRSAAAIAVGFFAVVVLSLGTDQLFHSLGVYPPWNRPMHDPMLNLLALSYRCVYTVLGCYLAARLAPRNPMRHALVLGLIGTFFAIFGAIAAISANLGPAWLPISLVVTALPLAWVGGALHRATQERVVPART